MPQKQIITGQKISPAKHARAEEFRREMTPAESRLWARLRAGRLEGIHFRRQQVIEPYIVDFYCHQADLVIEVDGSSHLDKQEYDHQRDQYLQERGLRVIRFTNTDVSQNLDGVLEEILLACRSATNPEGQDQANQA